MKAKEIIVKPITSTDAKKFVKAVHYSGRTAANSQLHFGVFRPNSDRLEGVMQFGPPMDKRKTLPLVSGTAWNGMLELNRMAFTDNLPKNSESRALGVALRMIKKYYPHIEWIVSFSDASQCGDGTIYRASSFVLTKITENKSIIRMPDGHTFCVLTLTSSDTYKREMCQRYSLPMYSGASVAPMIKAGGVWIPGFQLRYIYFINPEAKKRLTVPILPFTEIAKHGAGMYKGKPREQSKDSVAPDIQSVEGGATPTCSLTS
jgi:hypothetical protein